MKFSDGNWLNREGMELYSPAEVHDFSYDGRSATLYAPVRKIVNRGVTLNLPLLTIEISSPLENVIRVQVTHHEGIVDKGPKFHIQSQDEKLHFDETNGKLIFMSGELSVHIDKESFALAFFNGNTRLTGSSPKSLAYITENKSRAYMREQLDLDVGEQVYGLGERFTPFVKNGQMVDIWNEDGGTSSEQSYKNIPFFITNKGYGVFVNHPERVSFEVGSEKVSKNQFSVEGEHLDYFFVNGPSMKQVLSRYTALTGKPALPPAWSFGLWLTTSFTTNYDEDTVNHFVDGMLERDIPLRVFHFDCFWMKEFEWVNFEWDPRTFPDPAGMLKRLKDKGLNISLWINSYIAQKSKLFREAAERGYLVKRSNGDVWQWDMWQAGMGLVDFTNPAAREWFAEKLRPLLDMGVDSFKTDFGERIPTDVVYYDGSDPKKMHNYYPFLYNKTVYDLMKDIRGERDVVLFARSATAGSQQFPIHWGGDCNSTYVSMAETLRGGLSLGLSGFGFWSHDIGGFEETSTPDLYKRWVAFGLLSSHSRLHGSSSYRVPWVYDDEAVDVLRFFTKLKHRLMPYIMGVAVEARDRGLPVMRSMVLEFENDPTCHQLDRQFMLGDSLLVAPIFNEDGTGLCYLPEGRWTHFLSGLQVDGGTWHEDVYAYTSLPLFVRPNTVIPVGADSDRPDYVYEDGITFHAFSIDAESHIIAPIYDTEGVPHSEAHLITSKEGLTFEVQNASKPWSLLLRNLSEVQGVEGGEWVTEGSNIRVVPSSVNSKIAVQITLK